MWGESCWLSRISMEICMKKEKDNLRKGSSMDTGKVVKWLPVDVKRNHMVGLHSVCWQIWKTQQWPQDWKRSVFIPIPRKDNVKEWSNYRTIALISHTSKVMLKILQARLQQYMNRELPVFKLVLEKAEEPKIKLPTSVGSSKKQESSRKTSISALLTAPKSLTVWITTNCGKFFKRWEYQTTWPAFWEICMQVRQQQIELDMEQQTGSK